MVERKRFHKKKSNYLRAVYPESRYLNIVGKALVYAAITGLMTFGTSVNAQDLQRAEFVNEQNNNTSFYKSKKIINNIKRHTVRRSSITTNKSLNIHSTLRENSGLLTREDDLLSDLPLVISQETISLPSDESYNTLSADKDRAILDSEIDKGIPAKISEIPYVLGKGQVKLTSAKSGIPTGYAASAPTLDNLKLMAPDFLSGPHGTYTLTTTVGSNTNSILIDGTMYFYTPNESTVEKNIILTYLAGSCTVALQPGDASNYVFKIDKGGSTYSYYTFDTTKLPVSLWVPSATTSADYTYASFTPGTNPLYTPTYYSAGLIPANMSSVANLTFTKSGTSVVDFTFDNDLKTGSGTLAIEIPHNSDITSPVTEYYTYNYSVPDGYTQLTSRVTSLTEPIINKYFYNLSSSTHGGAIAISSDGSDITADFIQNHTTGASGAAISNEGAAIGTITSTFIGNYGSSSTSGLWGGAIRNKNGSICSIVGDFIGNYVNVTSSSAAHISDGGVLSNDATIRSMTGNFIGNHASSKNTEAHGGAIRNNYSGTLNMLTGNFIGNNAVANGESKNVYGGAVYNLGTMGNITGDFISNYITGKGKSYGGAIYNGKGYEPSVGAQHIDSIIGDFIGNKVTDGSESYGGAIYNAGAITRVIGDFAGNYVAGTGAKGGAIYNDTNKTIDIVSGGISGNVAKGTTAYGGAIYNAGTMSLSAVNGDFKFYDNKTIIDNVTSYNDIYNTKIINLNANNGYSIIFGGSVLGVNGILNLNSDTNIMGGTYVFNNTVANNAINLFNGGTVKIGSMRQSDGAITYGKFDLKSFTNSSTNDAVLDSQNTHNDYINLGALTLNSDLNLNFDADLLNPVTEGNITHYSDTYYASSFSGTGKLNINKIFVDSNPAGSVTEVETRIGNSVLINHIQLASGFEPELAQGITGNYIVTLQNKAGQGVFLTFEHTPDINLVYSARKSAAEIVYTLKNDDNVADDFIQVEDPTATAIGEQVPTELSVRGGNYDIDGSSKGGIIVSSGKTLNIQDVGATDGSGSITKSWHNFVSANGGAVYNNGGTLSIADSIFSDNSAATNGGAVYNSGTLSLGGTNIFTNNIANSAGNDIYNTGTINMLAGSETTIGSGISGSGGAISMASGSVLKADASISGNSFTMSGSTINIGAGGSLSFNAVTTNAKGSAIDSRNEVLNYIDFGAVTLNHDLNVKLDANLANPLTKDAVDYYTDTFHATSFTGNGKLVISNIIINESSAGDMVQTKVGNATLTNHIRLATDFVPDYKAGLTKSYVVSLDNVAGDGVYLFFEDSSKINLVHATRSSRSDVLYTMLDNENVAADLAELEITDGMVGTQASTSYAIHGEGYNVNGNLNKGIISGAGKTLEISNVGINGSGIQTGDGFYAFSAENGSVLNLSGTTILQNNIFKDNSASVNGGAIYNSGTLSLSGTNTFINNIANSVANDIYNTSTINLLEGSITNINSGISGSGGAIYMESGSELNVGGQISGNSITMTNSTINFVGGGSLNLNGLTNSGISSSLNTNNGIIEESNLGALSLTNAIKYAIDADLRDSGCADTIIFSNINTGVGTIVINSINIIGGSGDDEVDIVLTTNPDLYGVYTLSNDIMSNITKASGATYTVKRVYYDKSTGTLVFNGIPPVEIKPVIDDIKTASTEYLNLGKGNHATYNDFVTKKNANYPDIVVINNTIYYFKASEATEELNNKLRNLAATGSNALLEVGSADDYIFNFGGKYYTYTAANLPDSVWLAQGAPNNSYDFLIGDIKHFAYYDFKLKDHIGTTDWIESGSSVVPPVWDEETKTATGTVKIVIPHTTVDGEGVPTPVNRNRYFTYTYTMPDTYTMVDTRTTSTSEVNNKLFLNISNNLQGAAVFLKDVSVGVIESDFISNSTSHNYGGGAMALSGTGGYNMIVGNYIGNSATAENAGALNLATSGTINTIIGTFIANSAAKLGGAIYRKAGKIGTITGDFIGNHAGIEGGAIYHLASNIGVITGDFIANSAESNGGAIVEDGGNIDVITGDFIANRAGQDGGAIDIHKNIGKIIGNFVDNTAEQYGGALHITSVAELTSVVGSFTGNKADVQGGAIYNEGTIGISADNTSIAFFDNKANGVYNDIYNTGTVNLNASEDQAITLNGTIAGLSGVININSDSNIKGGQYIFNNIVSGNTLNLNNGAYIKFDSVVQPDKTVTKGTLNIDSLTATSAVGGIFNTENKYLDTHNIGTVNIASSYGLKLDIDLGTKLADTINTTELSSGEFNVQSISMLGNFSDWDLNEKVAIQVINNSNLSSTLKLTLADNLFPKQDDKYVFYSKEIGRNENPVSEVANWDTKFGTTITTQYVMGTIALAKTTTTDDSIGVTVTNRDTTSQLYSLGDTLKLVNQFVTLEDRTFSTTDATQTYNVTENLGVTTAGSLAISGTIDGDDISTLALGSYTGFILANATTLNFTDVNVTSNGAIAAVSNSDAVIELNNTILNGNISSTTTYDLGLSGVTTLNGTVGSADATFSSGTLVFNGNTFANAHTVGFSGGTVSLKDSEMTSYIINNLTSTSSVGYTMDLDVAAGTSDTIAATGSSAGTVTLTQLQLLNDTTSLDKNYKVQVLSGGLELALSSVVAAQLNEKEYSLGQEDEAPSYDPIEVTTKWNDIYQSHVDTMNVFGKLGLATTTSDNDSIGVIESRRVVDHTTNTSMGDTLSLVNNDTTNATKYFDANEDGASYTVSEDLGITNGTLNIRGYEGDGVETITLNNKGGFELSTSTSVLNVSGVTLGANTTIATVSNSGADINLNNVILNGAITGTTPFDMSIAGYTTLNGVVTNANITNTGNLTVSQNSAFVTSDFTSNNGSLNLKTNAIETQTFNDLTINGSMNYTLDMNLSAASADTLVATGDVTAALGSVIINSINLIAGTGSDEVVISLTNNSNLMAAYCLSNNILSNITRLSGVDYTVNTIDYNPTTGQLIFNKAVHSTLADEVHSTESDKSYDMISSENVAEDLGILGGDTLVVTGNGYAINGTTAGVTYAGITVGNSAAQELTIDDVSNYTGFDIAIINKAAGTTKISDTTFSGNSTADIDNSGKLELTGNNSFETIIDSASTGTTEVKGGTTSIADITQKLITISNGALTISSSITTTDGLTNDITNGLTMTGGTINSDITGSGSTYINSAGTVTISDTNSIEQTINLNAGTLIANADGIDGGIAVTSGTVQLNGGTLETNITGSGITDITGDVVNSSTIENRVEISSTGKLTTSTSDITNTNAIKNSGELIFNGSTDGSIGSAIIKNGTTGGIVEIAADSEATISMNNSITDNSVKLTSGTFDVTPAADSSGNIDLSGITSIIANGGKLSVQDSKTGSINLGSIDTLSSALNIDMDIDIQNTVGDLLSGSFIDSTSGISLKNIKLVTDAAVTDPVEILIANTSLANTGNDKISVGSAVISNCSSADSLMLTTVYDSTQGTLLHIENSSLSGAIISNVDEKAYVMGDSLINNSSGGLTMGGSKLSISGDGTQTITSVNNANDGIKIANSSQELTINNTGFGNSTNGFATAIDNSAGGTVNLNNVTMSGNTTDVNNAGDLNFKGTNNIETVTGTTGTTNVNSGTTTVSDSFTQDTLNIGNPNATPAVTDGTFINDGTLNATNVNVQTDNSIFQNNSEDSATIGTLTNDGTVENSGTLIATTIDNKGTTNNNSGATISGGTITNYGGVVENAGVISSTIDNKSGSVNSVADGITGGVINDGAVNLAASGSVASTNLNTSISNGTNGTGTTNIAGNINTNGNTIAQNTINVGKDKNGNNVAATLTNDSVVNANNISVTNGNTLELAQGSSTTVSDAVDVATGGKLNISDDAVLSAVNGVTITDGQLNLKAQNSDVTLNQAITGAGTNGVTVNVSGANTTNVNAAITNATSPVNVAAGSTLALNDGGSISSDATGATGSVIYLGAGSNMNVNSTTSKTLNNDIIGVGTGAEVNINKDGSAGKVTLDNTITAIDNVNVENGQVNIGTTADGKSNSAATLRTSTLNIKNGSTAQIDTSSSSYVLTNAVTGQSALDKLVLNGNSGTPGSMTNSGTQFNLANTVTDATVVVANGQLNLPNERSLKNSPVQIASGATLNAINNGISDYNSNIIFDNNSQLKIDIDAFGKSTDRFNNAQQNPGDSVVLANINLQNLDKIVNKNTSIDVASKTNLQNVVIAPELLNQTFKAMTPIMNMSARFSAAGMLNISPAASNRNDYSEFNPAIVAGEVAAQLGGYLVQLNSYDEAFRNLDMKMLMTQKERKVLKLANLYASEVQPRVFSETYLPEKDSAGWFRPYATFERVNLSHGPKVDNIMYGSFFGGDSDMKELSHGWDFQYSVYVGYNGSHQSYQDVSLYQNGGNLGVTGVWYKDNFFAGLTANAGANVGEASTRYGSEDIPMLMAGVAGKTGYNWELADGKFIVQPSFLMSYTFVNTFENTNAAGIRIHTDPLNAINIAPGLKLIGNLKEGWQPYASVQMVYNIMDKTNFYANDIALPELSVRPYVQYGVGVQKRWGERFTGFLQAMIRNGGRNGIAMSAGFRWAIGKDYGNKEEITKVSRSLKSSKNTSKNGSAGKKAVIVKSGGKSPVSKTPDRNQKKSIKSIISSIFKKMDGEPQS